MSETQLFAISAACAVCVLIALIWAKNKSWIWRKTIYLAMCGYGVSAMLFWLNRYTAPDLHPIDFFAGTTLFMLVGITLSYYLDLRSPVVIPDAVRQEMDSHIDAAVRIARYEAELTAQRTVVRQRGLRAALAGLILIGTAYTVVRSYGLAENMNGRQESFTKVLIGLVQQTHMLRGEIKLLSQKQDSTRRDVRTNGGRIGKLEARNRAVDKRDSLYAVRSLKNQAKMLGNQSKALKVLTPAKPETPKPIEKKEKKRNWLDDLFSHRGADSLRSGRN